MSNKDQGKVKEAAALQYTPGENQAPKLIAVGKGEAAEKIVEAARENNVPVYKDSSLAHSLGAMRIGEEIPPELYEVVAEILIFVSNLDKAYGEKHGVRK